MHDRDTEAFVLWLDRTRAGALAGRVEHVRSARRQAFASREELLRFLEGALGAAADEAGRRGDLGDR
jgi:hypothetical protein